MSSPSQSQARFMGDVHVAPVGERVVLPFDVISAWADILFTGGAFGGGGGVGNGGPSLSTPRICTADEPWRLVVRHCLAVVRCDTGGPKAAMARWAQSSKRSSGHTSGHRSCSCRGAALTATLLGLCDGALSFAASPPLP